MSEPQAILSYFSAINPLAGLSSTALRLYSALEVFRTEYRSPNEREWFRAPQLDLELLKIGFSKSEIEKGITALVDADLLQVRNAQNIRWYRLK
ncbi:MAG: hypothetical protein O7E52_15230 [Candidatus Poribacteria bacterium]|nr:hypothetical protein [Candidatus Poribacteria bacterium]